MKRVIYNELSQQRNPNNMSLLSVMFNHSPELSAKVGGFMNVSSIVLKRLVQEE